MAPDHSVYRFQLRAANTYLVSDGDLTLVDAGTPWDVEALSRDLARIGVAPISIDRVLLTHYDIDHVGTLAALGLDPDTPVYVGQPDADFLSGARKPPLSNHKGAIQRLSGGLLDRPDLPIRDVEDGDRIGGFEAFHTPGHTPGHTAYLHGGHDAAFVGDLVAETNGRLQASPRFICYDMAENTRSIRSLDERAPAFDVAAMGHGNPITSDGSAEFERLAGDL